MTGFIIVDGMTCVDHASIGCRWVDQDAIGQEIEAQIAIADTIIRARNDFWRDGEKESLAKIIRVARSMG